MDYLEASAARVPRSSCRLRSGRVEPHLRASSTNRPTRIAGFLVAHGVRPGDRVGVIVPKGAQAITAFFGIMKARAAYVPADYTAPAARNRTILADCEVKVAFLALSCASLLDEWPDDSALPSAVVFLGNTLPATRSSTQLFTWDQAVHHTPARVDGRVPTDLAYILYTSGSTGVPKGVMLSHENALSFVDWCSDVFAPSEVDRFSSHAPFHFDLSVLDIYVALKHGATVFVISEELGKSPEELAAFIATNRLTVWYSTPSILSLLTQFGNLHGRDCRSLRLVLFAGEVFPVKHLREVTRQWPWADYYNLYGPTETNVCTFARIPAASPGRTHARRIRLACRARTARRWCSTRLGRKSNQEKKDSCTSPALQSFLATGTVPNRTPRLFLERDGRRWYNTGDVVRLTSDGYVYLGRRDRMVKRRGYRIELGEIERGLYQHPPFERPLSWRYPTTRRSAHHRVSVVTRSGARLPLSR